MTTSNNLSPKTACAAAC